MNHVRCGVVLAAVALVGLTGGEASAGVKGSRFQGYIINNNGLYIPETHDFRSDGTYILTEVQPGGTFVFPGSYRETDLGVISFWSGVVSDGTPDGKADLNGVLLFGFVTTVNLSNLDFNITAKGYARKVGPAQRVSGKSVEGNGSAGGSSE